MPPKKGPKRKSRRPRVSTFAGSYGEEYMPSKAQWVAMEAAYGYHFSANDRAAITEIVRKYRDGACFERAAPFQDDVAEILATIQSGAKMVTDVFLANVMLRNDRP
jgi:hypothetical protein